MLNAHGLAREALAAFLRPVVPDMAPAAICTRVKGYEASFPLQWHAAYGAEEALARLRAAPGPCLLGVPLLEDMALSSGHICFRFSAGAYAAMLAHILASVPLPPLPPNTAEDVAYAIARMRMLARKEGPVACPDDPACRAALWLALGIPDAEGARREKRRREAAAALCGLLRCRSGAEQLALLPALGALGGAAARLLAYEWNDSIKEV